MKCKAIEMQILLICLIGNSEQSSLRKQQHTVCPKYNDTLTLSYIRRKHYLTFEVWIKCTFSFMKQGNIKSTDQGSLFMEEETLIIM